MLTDPSFISSVLKHVDEADTAVKLALESDDEEQLDCDRIRDIFLSALCGNLQEKVTGNVVWSAATEEFNRRPSLRMGLAELHVLISIDHDGGRFMGGFLAATSSIAFGDTLDDEEAGTLINVCHRMLKRSAMSFVFLFSESGTRVISCASVVSCPTIHLRALSSWSVSEFFTALLMGFVADPLLTSARDKRRFTIIDSVGADVTLFMNARNVQMQSEQEPPSPRYGDAKQKRFAKTLPVTGHENS